MPYLYLTLSMLKLHYVVYITICCRTYEDRLAKVKNQTRLLFCEKSLKGSHCNASYGRFHERIHKIPSVFVWAGGMVLKTFLNFLVQSSGPYEPHSRLNGSRGVRTSICKEIKPIAMRRFSRRLGKVQIPCPCLCIRSRLLIELKLTVTSLVSRIFFCFTKAFSQLTHWYTL